MVRFTELVLRVKTGASTGFKNSPENLAWLPHVPLFSLAKALFCHAQLSQNPITTQCTDRATHESCRRTAPSCAALQPEPAVLNAAPASS